MNRPNQRESSPWKTLFWKKGKNYIKFKPTFATIFSLNSQKRVLSGYPIDTSKFAQYRRLHLDF
jgi:hypothetical protein